MDVDKIRVKKSHIAAPAPFTAVDLQKRMDVDKIRVKKSHIAAPAPFTFIAAPAPFTKENGCR